MKSKIKFAAFLLTAISTTDVYAIDGMFTAEQFQKLLEGSGNQAQPVAQNQPTTTTITEASLNDSITALSSSAPASTYKIEDQKDGFKVNGQAFLDAEGRITQYAFDVLTGEVTYLVEITSGNYLMKFNRLGNDQDGIVIAKAQKSGAGWAVQLTTGKNLRGDLMTILPKGVLVTRDTSAFKYVPGVGVQNISVPQEWIVAPFQRGNVGATNFVLLEKSANKPQPGSVGELFGSFKALGGSLGLTKNEDYALLNIQDGKLTIFNISASGKGVASYSNCRQQNSVINRCDSMTTRESLYDKDGGRNLAHYYWRANWFNTPQGPIAIALESNFQDLTITDLSSGKRVVGFNRILGIHDFDAIQAADAKVVIVAQLGFEKKTIDDASEFMKSAQAIPEKK